MWEMHCGAGRRKRGKLMKSGMQEIERTEREKSSKMTGGGWRDKREVTYKER